MRSPFAESLVARGFEIVLMTEPIDEYCVSHLREFRSHPLVSIVKEGVDLCLSEQETRQQETEAKRFEPLCRLIGDVLHRCSIDRASVSSRMVESPCCILAGQHSMSGNMERISRAQTLRAQPSKDWFGAKRYFEINPKSAIIDRLRQMVDQDPGDKFARDLIWILYETALLQSGFALPEPSVHGDRVYRMIMMGLNIDDDRAGQDGDVVSAAADIEKEYGELFSVD